MRVSSVHRQALRRLLHHGLIRGWSAWHAHWEAKCYAYARLREVGNRLRAPATALAFSFWALERENAQHNARLHALLEQQRALEAALSTAREGAQAEAFQLVAEASLQASAIESRYEFSRHRRWNP